MSHDPPQLSLSACGFQVHRIGSSCSVPAAFQLHVLNGGRTTPPMTLRRSDCNVALQNKHAEASTKFLAPGMQAHDASCFTVQGTAV